VENSRLPHSVTFSNRAIFREWQTLGAYRETFPLHLIPMYENGFMAVVRTEVHPGARPDMRVDKWLWAARFFKTRALASKACDLGRIQANGLKAKPAREVRTGDMLQVENEGGIFQIEVLKLSEMRGPAAVAKTLYRETDASREARLKIAEERKAMQQYAPLPERRPSKRDRRRIIQFRGRA
jgi:ribosome-associated heat shock protein Hsp15